MMIHFLMSNQAFNDTGLGDSIEVITWLKI